MNTAVRSWLSGFGPAMAQPFAVFPSLDPSIAFWISKSFWE